MPEAGGRAEGVVLATGGLPVSWLATDRTGGVSVSPFGTLNLADHVGDDPQAVAANRARLAGWFGETGLATMGPVHGAEVAVVDGPGVTAGVDALLTRTPGLVLLALGADCVPLGLVGREWLAVVHCGWRGLLQDVAGATHQAMSDRGDPPVTAVLGPAVCGQCYPVPAARAELLAAEAPPGVAQAAVVRTADGQPGIDVRAGLVARLAGLGVTDVIEVAGCTVEDPELFSYRREGRTGRQGLALCRRLEASAT